MPMAPILEEVRVKNLERNAGFLTQIDLNCNCSVLAPRQTKLIKSKPLKVVNDIRRDVSEVGKSARVQCKEAESFDSKTLPLKLSRYRSSVPLRSTRSLKPLQGSTGNSGQMLQALKLQVFSNTSHIFHHESVVDKCFVQLGLSSGKRVISVRLRKQSLSVKHHRVIIS